jgi:phosphoribosylformylglycinamidine synthase
VSGNVSFYNETNGRAILPTPTVAAVGLVRDELAIVPSWFSAEGHEVLLLGRAASGGLGGSEYVARHTGMVAGPAPRIDLELEARLQSLLVELAEAGLSKSAHDVSEGGLLVALAECCTLGPRLVGAELELEAASAESFFGEAPSRVILSAEARSAERILALAEQARVPCRRLGSTRGERLVVRVAGAPAVDVSLSAARDAREHCLDAIVGDQ